MTDFYEIDFLEVHKEKSGDAISVRYKIGGETYIHVVDGGYAATGDLLVAHINKYYGKPAYIDHVIVTHPDQDHAEGVQAILDNYTVGALWMLLPWNYVDELIDRFARYTNLENLKRRLREDYPYLAELEKIAKTKGIPIYEPFQDTSIGAFTVMAPTRARYLDLVVTSSKTPQEAVEAYDSFTTQAGKLLRETARLVKSLAFAAWGKEYFPPSGTSNENEMSVVQHARFSTHNIVLTADAGRDGLTEAADYAPYVGLILPGGVTRFQVPHHGGRHNVSTELLDRWFGKRLAQPLFAGTGKFTAVVSAAQNDPDHPKKAVVRGFIHRGAKVLSTDDGRGIKHVFWNAPDREGWEPATPMSYPDEMED